MNPPMLRTEGVSVDLGGKHIVEGVDLAVAAGELVALVGPNGAGKTTLMRACAGLIPAKGRVLLDGRPLDATPARTRARLLAYLPQGHTFHWPLPVATVVALGRTPHGDPFARPSDADRDAVREALAVTGTEAFADRAVTTLSGGERARVALARVLATQAPLILADEPTMSLDPRQQLVVMTILHEATQRGAAVLVVVHDLALAARFADRVAVMERGRLVADGPPASALSLSQIASTFGVEAVLADTPDGALPIPVRTL